MREERLLLLMQAFAEVIHEHAFFRELRGTL
jgi:hypothetical protein